MKTIFGKAVVVNGYYTITSRKEGNYGVRLHKLIWEKFNNCSVPKGYVIHHKNGNKLDNCILNLQLLSKSEHTILHHTGSKRSIETKNKISNSRIGEKNHFYGKKHTNDTKIKMSVSSNTSGYFRVSKNIKKECKQGFYWRYVYFEDGKQKAITSVDLDKLKEKVLAKGLEWFKLEEKGEINV